MRRLLDRLLQFLRRGSLLAAAPDRTTALLQKSRIYGALPGDGDHS
jgi:hypothetical protein